MRIILRDSLTGLYYGGHQTWCAEVSGVVDFDSFETAASLALAEELKTVNVVLRYEEPRCELVLPLSLYPAITPYPPRTPASPAQDAGPASFTNDNESPLGTTANQ